MVDNRLTAWLRPVVTLFALAGILSLGACGGGGGPVGGSPYDGGGAPLVVLPAAPTVYSGVAATLTITGGSSPYSVFSSDASILPATPPSGNTVVLLANQVNADTTVTLTVRDANGQSVPVATTVKPSLLLPASITITGNPVCAGSNATLCSGQDGTATVVVTGLGGATLSGRSVRFDVVLGTFSLIAANSTVAAQSVTVQTDQNGLAAVTLRVPVNAPTQFATVRATDVTSGSSVLGQFTIAQFVNGDSVLSVIPTGTTTFTGDDKEHCANSGIAAFYIFGGTPPYTVRTNFPTAVSISGSPVPVSGGSFFISPTGPCFTGLTFAITDSAGRTLLTPPTVDNVFGTLEPTPPAVVVTPATASGVCKVGQTFSFLATGGTGTFSAAITANGTITITPSGDIVNAVAAVTGGSVNISFTGTALAQATGTYTITVSSGKAVPGKATLTCS
jgi:hypothetical protein